MRALAFVKWAMMGLIFGVLVTACGDSDDNKKNKASEYVEINNICYDRDRERETSRSRCIDEDSPRFYTQNNRCYNYENDDLVKDRECDLYFEDFGIGNGLTYNYGNLRDVRCETTRVFDPYYGQPINCQTFSGCRGQIFVDSSGNPVRCM